MEPVGSSQLVIDRWWIVRWKALLLSTKPGKIDRVLRVESRPVGLPQVGGVGGQVGAVGQGGGG